MSKKKSRSTTFWTPTRVFAYHTTKSICGAHIDSHPTERTQTQQELDRMHHLGQEFIGNEDQPLMFKFTPWGKLSLDQTLALEIGKSQAPNSDSAPNPASEQPSRYTPIFNQSPTSRLLIAQTEFERRKSRALHQIHAHILRQQSFAIFHWLGCPGLKRHSTTN